MPDCYYSDYAKCNRNLVLNKIGNDVCIQKVCGPHRV